MYNLLMLTINNQIPQLTIIQMSLLLGIITLGWSVVFYGLDHKKFKLRKKHSQKLFRISTLIGTLLALLSALIVNSNFAGEYFHKFYGWPLAFAHFKKSLDNTVYRTALNLRYFLDLYFYTLVVYFIFLFIFAIKNKDKKLFCLTIATLLITILLTIVMAIKNRG